MRDFTDSAGNEWTVFEVSRGGTEEDTWSYLPRGFRAGWLCFESDAGKRRLSPVPDEWNTLEPLELEQMLRRAAPVVRGRPNPDFADLNLGSSEDPGFQP